MFGKKSSEGAGFSGFGQSPFSQGMMFEHVASTSAPTFGQGQTSASALGSSNQGTVFGETHQSGQMLSNQDAIMSQTSFTDKVSFSDASSNQVTAFGQKLPASNMAAGPGLLQGGTFGQITTNQSATVGGNSSTAVGGSSVVFNQGNFMSGKDTTFGQTFMTQSPIFSQSPTVQGTEFGQISSAQSSTVQETTFGQIASTQSPIFSLAPTAQGATFGQMLTTQSPIFSQAPIVQGTTFGQIPSTQSPAFSQTPTVHREILSTHPSIFSHTPTVQGTTFGHLSTTESPAIQKSAFGQISSTQPPIFSQVLTTQAAGFDQKTPGQSAAFAETTSHPGYIFGGSATTAGVAFGENIFSAGPSGTTSSNIIFAGGIKDSTRMFGTDAGEVQKLESKPLSFGQFRSPETKVFAGKDVQTEGSSPSKSTSQFLFAKSSTEGGIFGSANVKSKFSSVFNPDVVSSVASVKPVGNTDTLEPNSNERSSFWGNYKSAAIKPFKLTDEGQKFSLVFQDQSKKQNKPTIFGGSSQQTVFGVTKKDPSLPSKAVETSSFSVYNPISSIFGGSASGKSSSRSTFVPSVKTSIFSGKETASKRSGSIFKPKSAILGKPVSEGRVAKKEENVEEGEIIEDTEDTVFRRETTHKEKDRLERQRTAIRREGLFGKAVSSLQKAAKDSHRRRRSSERSTAEGTPRLKRLVSTEELVQIKSILCKGIQDDLNKKEALLRHFSKFGKVTKIYPNPGKQSATVHFIDHAAAEAAKKHGTQMKHGSPLVIFWSQSSSPNRKSQSSPPDEEGDREHRRVGRQHGTEEKYIEKKHSVERKKEEKQTHAKEKITHPQKSCYDDADEVNEELRAMAGTGDFGIEGPKLLERPKALVSEKHSSSSRLFRFSNKLEHQTKTTKVASSEPEVAPATVKTADLQALLQQPAHSAGERYKVLDIRDKLMRLKQTKQYDITTAVNMVGTCPDMCPEKERYSREQKRRLASYEQQIGKEYAVDHNAAIKEYSRSSADQEEPLLHDLRPGPVLSLTMDYLVCNIMDKSEEPEENIADWYHYVWDRTRGIRKDITQQQLCDQVAAGLVEKCARFHIHCAARLCEEDMSVFDQKINNENLTKCLQTLKHIYYDLKVKNLLCPTEAEFRGYDILLNLNEGDILRQVQQFDLKVRESPQVKFALQLFWAVNSNNYVQFFKLVRKASYLEACILQRYFCQIRTRAIETTIRAYCPSKQVVQFLLSKLVALLGFEGTQEATMFSNNHGLVVDKKKDLIFLSKSNFHIADSPIDLIRAKNIIEGKRQCSVGEVVNGGPLPVNPRYNYMAHFSFDSKGYLKQEAWTAQDQTVKAKTIVQSEAPKGMQEDLGEEDKIALQKRIEREQQIIQEREKLISELSHGIANELLLQVTSEEGYKISTEILRAVQTFQMAREFIGSLVHEVTDQLTKEICRNVMRELKTEELQKQLALEEAERQQQEKAARREKLAEALQTDILDETVNEQAKELALLKMKEIKTTLYQQCVEKCAAVVMEESCIEVAESEAQRVVEEVIKETIIDRDKKLAEVGKLVQKLRLSHYFSIWQKVHAKRKRLKASMQTFPPYHMGYSLDEQLEKLAWGGRREKLVFENLDDILTRRKEIDKLQDMQNLCQHLHREAVAQQLDVSSVIGNVLIQNQQKTSRVGNHPDPSHLFWKLIVALPDTREGGADLRLREWIKTKLKKGNDEESLKKPLVLSTVTVSPCHKLSLCVRTVEGVMQNMNRTVQKQFFGGTSAYLFICQPTAENMKAIWDRLHWLMSMNPCDPAPCVLMLPFVRSEELDYSGLVTQSGLQTLTSSELISAYEIFPIGEEPFSIESDVKLHQCLQWLAEHSPTPPVLTRKYLRDYIEEYLMSSTFMPIYQNLAHRRKQGLLHQPPQVLINLYNSALHQMAEVCTQEELCDISWPIPEFSDTEWNSASRNSISDTDLPPVYWNDEEYMKYLSDLLLSLELPQFEDWPANDWNSVCTGVWQYCQTVQRADNDHTSFFSRVRQLLLKAYRQFESLCFMEYEVEECEPLMENIPWTDIIQACIDYQLQGLDDSDPFSAVEDRPLEICYMKEHLEEYNLPKEWTESIGWFSEKGAETLDETIHRVAAKRKKLEDVEQLPSKVTRGQEKIEPDRALSRAQEDCHNLSQRIQYEREKSLQFEELLALALDEKCDPVMDPETYVLSNTAGVKEHKHQLGYTRIHPQEKRHPFYGAGGLYPSRVICNTNCRLMHHTHSPHHTHTSHGYELGKLSFDDDTDDDKPPAMENLSLSESVDELRRDIQFNHTLNSVFEKRLVNLLHIEEL